MFLVIVIGYKWMKSPYTCWNLPVGVTVQYEWKRIPCLMSDWTEMFFHTVPLSDTPAPGMHELCHQRRWRPKAVWSSCEGALFVHQMLFDGALLWCQTRKWFVSLATCRMQSAAVLNEPKGNYFIYYVDDNKMKQTFMNTSCHSCDNLINTTQ